jgi:hypothetical protein
VTDDPLAAVADASDRLTAALDDLTAVSDSLVLAGDLDRGLLLAHAIARLDSATYPITAVIRASRPAR